MGQKHILIVDDDKSILRMLEFGLKKLGPNYQISTAENMTSAMRQIEQSHIDLIITDYMMPGMTGVDLVRAVRSISPATQVVLMTAYGTNKLRDTTDNLHIDGYLNKPFTMDQIRDIVRQSSTPIVEPPLPQPAGAYTFGEAAGKLAAAPVDDKATEYVSVAEHLHQLQINAGSRAVMLINHQGMSVQVVGEITPSKISQICELVAGNHYGPAKLAHLLDNKKPFKASFYEGDSYNLYVCDVNGKCLLAVVFDVKLRPGVVWFYTKQTATALEPLIV
ncbi:MAG: response regulator [Anaerolineaceae bacterium]|nr:response regulator [Anaerolineaceae bacterium]